MDEALIHELFAQRAAETPDAPALVHGGITLTYQELNEAAEAFAVRLHEAGVGPGAVVPVILPRSIDLVVSFLGILKRGAAYAAFDRDWPSARLARLTRLTGAPVVVTPGEAPGGVRALVPPVAGGRPTPGPVSAPPAEVTADRPATIFFTSGTTGEPKGVLSPHAGTVRLFADCAFAELGPRTVMPLTSAVPWDALTLELWSVLLNGGCSVVVDEPYLLPAKLRSLVAEHGVNCVSLTATLFHMFVEEDIDAFAGVDQVFVGGEKVSPARLGTFLARFPSTRLLHCYGPVETTLFATTHRVRPADCTLPEGVPLGGPVARTGLYVRDGERTCAPGERGELLISGAGLALGYLGDPERTALSFPTLRIDGTEQRVYRTGDLVHRTPDGRLHFDGRADRQIKIRGHRIEPAEVEQVAHAYPGVGQCTALPLPDGAGGYGALALAYTSAPGQEPAENGLREHLRKLLPHYLMPGTLLRLPALPLNANGKLDTAGLLRLVRDLEPAAAPQETTAHAPTRLVAATVAGVLGRSSVPLHDGFFSLGGNSLQLGVVCSRLTQETGVPVPVSVAMRHPSVAELAAWLADRMTGTAPPAEDTPEPGEPSGSVDLTETQTAFWTRQMIDPNDVSALCPLVWSIEGPVDAEALDAALADVRDRHDSLRSEFGTGPDGLRPAATPAPPATWSPAGGRLRPLAPQKTREAALTCVREALMRPLDPESGPVWRSVLASVPSDGSAVLGLVLHHVAFDGHSEAVLVGDLATSYAARARGEEPHWPRPAPTLRQTRKELERVLGQTNADSQRRYWKDRLTGTPDLALPRPDRGGHRADAATLGFVLGPAETATVKELARRHGTTPFTVLLAAVARALHHLTGQSDFAVGVPVSRRATPLLGEAVGCLVDTVCVRLDSFPDAWDALLRDTADSTVTALSHQDIPFAEVVRLVNPGRSERAPLYQFLFVYQESAPSTLRLGATEAVPVRVPAAEGVCEVVTEVWPGADGTFEVDITYQTDRVRADFPPRLRDLVGQLLRSAASPAAPTPA